MSRNSKWIMFALSVIVGVSVVMVYAGSLTPPSGPVAPTMRTLDEVYGAAASCQKCAWSYKYYENVGAQEIEVLPQGTSGVLHGMVSNSYFSIYDGPVVPEGKIAFFSPPNAGFGLSTGQATLDVQFSNGLTIKNTTGTSGAATILYRIN